MSNYSPTSPYSGSSGHGAINGDQLRRQSITPGDVPTSVHDLLTSTKQLQETLRLWSLDQATEDDVSNLYVRIGNEFNTVISAFAYHQIDLSDLHSFPTELRTVLERSLSEEPAPEVFDTFVPELRQVLCKLLKGLQSRQGRWNRVVQQTSSSRASVSSQ